jgi:hypothetical protein
VNEIQLIRAQLDVEREHALAIADACAAALERADAAALTSASPLEQFRQACVDYLVCVLAWFEERDRRLASLVNQYGPQHPTRDALDEALARRGRSREALEKLEVAFAPAPDGSGKRPWQQFALFLRGPWCERRDALDALLASNSRPTEWRTFSGIDADGILEERTRLARVRAALPPGVKLAPRARPPLAP